MIGRNLSKTDNLMQSIGFFDNKYGHRLVYVKIFARNIQMNMWN
jgi:hypothetical protein